MLRPPPAPPLFPYTTLFRSPFSPLSKSGCRRFLPALPARKRRNVRARIGHLRSGLGTRACRDLTAIPLPHHEVRQPLNLRSEEHTSELQSHHDLVCRLLLEK